MKLIRIGLATLVLATATAAPAAAATHLPTTSPTGLCRLWPRLCT